MQLRRYVLAITMLVLPTATFAQYTPSKAQFEKLAKQKAKLMKLQVEIARLQSEVAFEVGTLGRACMEVVIANRWPLDVNCNPQSLAFGVPSQPDPPLSTLIKRQPTEPVPSPAEQKKP